MHKVLVYLLIRQLIIPPHVSSINPPQHQDVHVVIVYVQPLVSSLSAGDCLVHRLRKDSLTGSQDSQVQRVTILEAAHIQLRRELTDVEQGNARNMWRSLINVLYENKQELSSLIWRSHQDQMYSRHTLYLKVFEDANESLY
jgi:hypothetical protein